MSQDASTPHSSCSAGRSAVPGRHSQALTALTASCTSPLHASGSTRAAFQDSPPPSTGSTTTSCITGPLITITDGSYHNTHNHHIICRGAGPGAGRCTVPASALARWPGQRGSRGRCCVLAPVRRRWRRRWWLTGRQGQGPRVVVMAETPQSEASESVLLSHFALRSHFYTALTRSEHAELLSFLK